MIVLLFTGHLRILNDTAFGDCIKVFILPHVLNYILNKIISL